MLTKFLVPILLFSEYDMFLFADKISSFCPDHLISSLHVESLFTNIILNKVIEICTDDLFCDTTAIHNLDFNVIRDLLTLAA